MAYRVVGVNSLEDGSFYFRVQHWPDEPAMRGGSPPEWENDFVTDLHLLAGHTLSRVKLRHDPDSQTTLMQRADTLEWAPVSEWHSEGGLLAQGVEPAREDFSPGQTEIETMVRDTVRRYIARRSAALRQVPISSRILDAVGTQGDGLQARDGEPGSHAADSPATGAAGSLLTDDTTDPRLRALPSLKATLHPHLQAIEGLEEVSL